jgi:hypothetical protein
MEYGLTIDANGMRPLIGFIVGCSLSPVSGPGRFDIVMMDAHLSYQLFDALLKDFFSS